MIMSLAKSFLSIVLIIIININLFLILFFKTTFEIASSSQQRSNFAPLLVKSKSFRSLPGDEEEEGEVLLLRLKRSERDFQDAMVHPEPKNG